MRVNMKWINTQSIANMMKKANNSSTKICL